jgi:hypothetical protein
VIGDRVEPMDIVNYGCRVIGGLKSTKGRPSSFGGGEEKKALI